MGYHFISMLSNTSRCMHICIQMELIHISKNERKFTNMQTVFEVKQVSNQQKL